jgi:hypothetical protein
MTQLATAQLELSLHLANKPEYPQREEIMMGMMAQMQHLEAVEAYPTRVAEFETRTQALVDQIRGLIAQLP